MPIDSVKLSLHAQEHLGLEVPSLYLLNLFFVHLLLESFLDHQVYGKVVPVLRMIVLLAWLPKGVEVCVDVAGELLLVRPYRLDNFLASYSMLPLEVVLHSGSLLLVLEAETAVVWFGNS